MRIAYHELNSSAIQIALRYTIPPVMAVVFASLQHYLVRGGVAAEPASDTVPKLSLTGPTARVLMWIGKR